MIGLLNYWCPFLNPEVLNVKLYVIYNFAITLSLSKF